MIAALDVQYHDDQTATSACVLIDRFESESTVDEIAVPLTKVEPYVPGEFYRRELPCLLAVLECVEKSCDHIVVDSYVDLPDGKGLGRWLFESLDEMTPVIGVAKSKFDNTTALPLLRGGSERPLFITAAGMSNREALDLVSQMHGDYRIPTMLRLVDQIARGNVQPRRLDSH